jgi:predicted dehydrogenase
MYLETLELLEDVSGILLVDPEEAAARVAATGLRKSIGVCPTVDKAVQRDDITQALVLLPNSETPKVLVQCIDAGKHVFTEKPGAKSAAAFQPVLDALQRTPVAFAIAYLNRMHPLFLQMRDLVHQGAIGRLTSVEMRMVTTQVRFRNPGHWLFQRDVAGGGIMAWLGCHWLDMLRYSTGQEVSHVMAELATTSGEAIDVEDTAALAFRMAGGAVGSMHAGYLLARGGAGYRAARFDQEIHFRGSLGDITYRRGATEEPLLLESVAPGWESATERSFAFTLTPYPGYAGIHGRDFLAAFFRAGPLDPSPASALDALRVLETLDAAYESGRTGRSVEVKSLQAPLSTPEAG